MILSGMWTAFTGLWGRVTETFNVLQNWLSALLRNRFVFLVTAFSGTLGAITLGITWVKGIVDVLTTTLSDMDVAADGTKAAAEALQAADSTNLGAFAYCSGVDILWPLLVIGIAFHVACICYGFAKSWLENGW